MRNSAFCRDRVKALIAIMSKHEKDFQAQHQVQQTIPTYFPTPVMYNSPVVAGVPTIKKNTVAFVIYAILFIISLSMTVLASFVLLFMIITWNTWYPHDDIRDTVMLFTLVEGSVAISQAITFGLGAFRNDWLASGNVPLKLSLLAIVPLINIIVVGTFFTFNPLAHVLTVPRLILYFVLAFWDKTLPYNYIK